jgi:hypothetical protein
MAINIVRGGSRTIISEIEALIDDKCFFDEVCKALDEAVDTKGMSKWGYKNKIISILSEYGLQRRSEEIIKEVINGADTKS